MWKWYYMQQQPESMKGSSLLVLNCKGKIKNTFGIKFAKWKPYRCFWSLHWSNKVTYILFKNRQLGVDLLK